MKPSRLLILLLILTLLPISGYAIDFGFYINNRTVLKYDKGSTHEVHAEQKDMFSIWMSHHFQENFFVKIKGHLELGTEYNKTLNEYQFLPTGDIDTFLIGGKIKLENSTAQYFSFQVGRIFFTDFTREIAFTPLDGFQFSLGFEQVDLSVTTGYTGLVYDWSNTMRMSYNDAVINQDWSLNKSYNSPSSEKGVKDYSAYHGPPRFIGNIEVKAPSIFKGQDLYFSLMGQADLWQQVASTVTVKDATEQNADGGTPVHTLYSTLGLKGAITAAVYYNVFASFGTGVYYEYLENADSATGYSYQPKGIASGLIGVDIEGLIEKALFSKVGFSFRYASGESGNDEYYGMTSDGKSNSLFIPLNVRKNNLVFNPLMSNLITMGLNYSFKPFSSTNNEYMKNFMIAAEIKTFLRGSETAISEEYIMDSTVLSEPGSSFYVGTELDILVNIISISDFNLFFTTGVFFPNEAAFVDGFDKPRLETELNFSISL